MSKKKIFIAGCGGMLGEAFYRQFKDDYVIKCTDKDVNAPWISFLDFRDFERYGEEVAAFDPDYLFHLGAYTDLEWCEQNPEETYLTNTLCVENAVHIANSLDIPLLYISTAGIFDGKKPLYDDWDQPNPLGVYARSKYMGERFVVENARKYLVCRAGWMMGAGPSKDKKFVQKILKQIKEGKKELFVVNDKGGTPTYTQDFARTVKMLLKRNAYGLFNCVCEGETSRLEVCEEILKILGLSDVIRINVVPSSYFAEEFFAERPDSECLWNRKLHILGIDTMRDWRVALKDYLDNYYAGYLN